MDPNQSLSEYLEINATERIFEDQNDNLKEEVEESLQVERRNLSNEDDIEKNCNKKQNVISFNFEENENIHVENKVNKFSSVVHHDAVRENITTEDVVESISGSCAECGDKNSNECDIFSSGDRHKSGSLDKSKVRKSATAWTVPRRMLWTFTFLVMTVGTGSAAPFNSSGFDSFKCGCAEMGRQMKRGRVVGGDELAPGGAPWLAALTRGGSPHCGATLISKKHLLTAAHCIKGFELKDIAAWLGAHSLAQAARSGAGLRLRGATLHEDFDGFTFRNDIAVLELEAPVELSSLVRPICLPTSDAAEYASRTAMVAGWGKTGEQASLSDVPRKALVQVWGKSRCKSSGYPAKRMSGEILCAGRTAGGVDACHGDSGGPLVLPGPTGAMEVIGVVSWGRGCARPNLPGVYTRVAGFLPFLHDILAPTCS